jgi:hypothetical protein
MNRKVAAAVVALAMVVWGCGERAEEPAKPSPAKGPEAAAPAPKGGEAPAPGEGPVVQFEPSKITAKAGEEVTMTGRLLNKPEKVSRWTLSLAWHFGDGEKYVGAPDTKARDIQRVVKHAWKEKGTYTMKLEFYAGNKVLVESTAQVVVE